MKINNSTEFLNFVRNNNFINLSPEISSFVRCTEEYGRMCPCDSEASRKAKNEQCRALYNNFLSKASQFKEQFLSKASDNSLIFCIDGQAIINITR